MRHTTTSFAIRSSLGAALGLGFTLATIGCGDNEAVVPPPTRSYELTIENLTVGQPFSPGVVVLHTAANPLFQIGGGASEGLRALAELGDPTLAASERRGRAGVEQVITLTDPTHRVNGPGPTSQTMSITVHSDGMLLSLAMMLLCTNDGFTGIDGVALPADFQTMTYDLVAYDAGTEVNDEAFTSIGDSCQLIGPIVAPVDGDLHTPESGSIAPHLGILGVGDLVPAAHGFVNPVGRLTIQRIQ